MASSSKNKMTSKLTVQSGFTLIEILLVMMISSILILGMTAAFRQARLICAKTESQRPIYHSVRIVTETLRQELSCLYFPQADEKKNVKPFSLVVLPDGTTELSFYTLTPAWKTSPVSSRVAKVGYRFRKNTDIGESILERVEQPCSGEKVIGIGTLDVILKGLLDFQVWALDPNSSFAEDPWKQSYDSQAGPPKALRILLKWPETINSPAVDFQTTIAIGCSAVLPL